MSRVTSAGGPPTAAGGARPEAPSGGVPHPRPDDAGAGEVELLQEEPTKAKRSSWGPILAYVVTVFVLVTLNFAVPRLMPGDPIDALMAQGSPTFVADEAVRQELAAYYNLDDSMASQYGHYLAGLVKGDLGFSINYRRPVGPDIAQRLPWTLLLITVAMLLGVAIGLPAGIHSAWKRGRGVDRGLLGLFLSVQNLPIYFVGAMVLLVFGARLGWFPMGGGSTPFAHYPPLQAALDVAYHLALPALLLAVQFAGYQYLVMRSAMVSELGSDYLLGGRAKGLPLRRLRYGYAGRNALLPVITVIGMQFSLAVTSVIFIEQIFSYPGVGLYMFNATFTRDYPAMQGAFLVLTIMVVTVNLVVDLLYRRLDPRTTA